jgi:hypothetical protein
MVMVLPGFHTTLDANNVSTVRMNTVLTALRQYEAANGVLPCPADASMATGNANYGQPAVYAGTAVCGAGVPFANYVDPTNMVAIGMVPVRALGLSNDCALDGYGRYITYAVDTRTTMNVAGYPTWSLTPPGNILIDDNGVVFNTVVALVSYGADGYGAWIPLNASSGTGVQFNTGSQDLDQWINAQSVSTGGNFGGISNVINSRAADEAGNTVTFVKKPPTSTFDDLVVYKNSLWNINQLPLSIQNMVTVSPPPNGVYVTGELLPFQLVFPYPVSQNPTLPFTVNGAALTATYASGSGTNTLSYTPSSVLQSSLYAPETGTSGVIVTSPMGFPVAINNTNAEPLYFNFPNTSGILNGTGSGSVSSTAGVRISAPSGITVDGSGNAWVVDTLNSRIVEWVSGSPYTNNTPGGTAGTGTSYFTNPSGIIINDDSLWVVDTNNSRVVNWTTGNPPGYKGATFGTNGNGVHQFNYPTGITANAGGGPQVCGTGPCFWIADTGNNRIVACTISGPATSCGTITSTFSTPNTFSSPTGVAILAGSNLLVTDTGNNRVLAFTNQDIGGYTPFSGTLTCTGSGSSNCLGSAGYNNGQFKSPTGITTDSSNNIWVVDSMNNRVQEFNSTGTWLLTIGGGGLCSTTSVCTYSAFPTSATISSSFAAFCYNNAPCAAGNGNSYFNNPTGITYSSSTGNIYVVDDNNSRVQIFTTAGAPVSQFGSYGTGNSNFSFR